MSGTAIKKEKTAAELREFGEVMATAALVFSLIGYFKRGHYTGMILSMYVLALLFLAFGFLRPMALKQVEHYWMKFAERLGSIMTVVIMLITFFVIVTPVSLLMRVFRRDPLRQKIDRARASYWEPVDPQGSASRYFLPY